MANTNAWSNALAAANNVTRKRQRKKNVSVEHADRVLYCLHLSNPLRRLCIKIVEWKYPF